MTNPTPPNQDTGVVLKACPTDGIDVAIVAFLGRRLSGGTIEEAQEDARAMLELFGVPHDPRTPENR